MKKVYQKLFGSENPVIAVSFMCLIYVAAHFFIKMGLNAKYDLDYNDTYMTIDAPAYIIYELEKVVWWQWTSLILAIAGYMAIVIYNGGLGYGQGDKTFGYFFLAGAFLVISGFFPVIFSQGDTKYRKTLDEKSYQYYKANQDKLIEIFK